MNRCARPVVRLATAIRHASQGTRTYVDSSLAENVKKDPKNVKKNSKKQKRSKVPRKNPITGEPIEPPSGKVEIKGHSVLLGARLRRSFLYVPAHNERFLEKALKSAADCIVFDLEDGVAPSEKKQARENLKNLWERLATEGYRIGENQGADLCLRINHEGWLGPKQWEGPSKKIQAPSLEIDQDLDLLALRSALKLGVNVVAPKVNFPYDIRNIRELVLQKQKAVVDPSRQIKRLEIIPTIETALATLSLQLFHSHAKQFSAMVFASEDYCASMGIPRTQDYSNMLFARSQLVHVCKASRNTPIDMVCQDFKDLSILEKECEEGVHLGFEGKQAIHPDQIETINRIFSPKTQEVEWAKALLEAVEKNKTDGAFEFEGKMVDRPVFRKAENILEIYNWIEKFEKDKFVTKLEF
ncbi:hypothetical protein TWF569_003496 [Orbilia oligospora]|uniref:HpcH/HpaI aldolase/citrate lyase domain-containing protein n=1 Tax=Orbilia oligospora TaxID=2813651 RepID=A0A7C8NNA5_ORBOL|nr:hypothetical protein TWF706_007868 [Orbilia oligospora]KAF3127336.1 hypothetical protein TWF703_010032 [Orbilia oligospora]KAF3151780.1 hypothetical protein TWF569_003496 [Orbilia oligospora]